MGRLQEGELHPLQNSLILEIIFQNANCNNLKSYRQVCKQWYSSSMKVWKSTSKVVISGSAQLNEVVKYLQKRGNLNSLPSHIQMKDVEKSSAAFWKAVGSSIKTLELIECKFPSLDSFRRVIYKECPNLEHLSFENISLEKGEPKSIVEPTEWVEPSFGENTNLKSLSIFRDENLSCMELLSHFPAIECIKYRPGYSGKENELFTAIKIIRQHDSDKLKLKQIYGATVKWFRGIRPKCLDVLLDPGLSLETLSLKVDGSEGTQSFIEVLGVHAGTLKNLSVKGDIFMDKRTVQVRIPKRPLEKLEILTLADRPIGSFEFLKFTPNLRKLVIEPGVDKCIKATNPNAMKGFELPSCTELEIYERSISPPILKSLLTWFPNVRELKISGLTNAKFLDICEHCPNLVSLEAEKSRINYLGVPAKKYAPAKNKKSRKSGKRGLANLKYLQCLSLDAVDIKGYYCVPDTKVSLEYQINADVIKKLENLRHLRIQNYELVDAPRWNKLLAKYPWQ